MKSTVPTPGSKDIPKISRETAEKQLVTLFEYYELEVEDLEDAQGKAIEAASKRIIKAICKGRVSIEEGDPIKVTQYLKKPKGDVSVLSYAEISCKAKIAMKSKLDTDAFGRICALTGSLTNLGETAMASLTGIDMSIMECLGVIFLQV